MRFTNGLHEDDGACAWVAIATLYFCLLYTSPHGVIVSTGGQIPNNLAMHLDAQNVPILGTAAKDIDNAEDPLMKLRCCFIVARTFLSVELRT